MNMKTLVALPAYNEEKVIAKVINDIKKEGYTDILVVDDCSKDDTSQRALNAGALVLRHPINRGAGGATATAIEYAKREKYDILVLMDSDGQHSPKDIKKLIKEIKNYDIIIGSRMIEPKGMPLSRRILNSGGSLLTWGLFGLYVKDSQSGFKVLGRKAIEKINITYDRFEFCSEMIGEIYSKKLKYKEIPIKVIYTDHSIAKGQSFKNGIKMILRFILRT
jgi:glycosyltransferase involved in cell wall biosynthesis